MEKKIEIPEGIEVEIRGNEIAVKGPKGEVKRPFKAYKIRIKKDGNSVVIYSEAKKDTKKIRASLGTWEAHIKNMFTGVTKMWEARLKAVYSHFPMRQSIEGNRFLIHNFLGEKKPRSAKIPEGVEVKIEKDVIVVTGIDKEKVGQACGNIENAARIKGYDRRVFQDGIYLVQKCRPLEN